MAKRKKKDGYKRAIASMKKLMDRYETEIKCKYLSELKNSIYLDIDEIRLKDREKFEIIKEMGLLRCSFCSKGAERVILFPEKLKKKKGWKKLGIAVCEDHLFDPIAICENPNIPFMIAPCHYFFSYEVCDGYLPMADPRDPITNPNPSEDVIYEWDQSCMFGSELNVVEVEDSNMRCEICGVMAEFSYISPKDGQMHYICSRHSYMQSICRLNKTCWNKNECIAPCNLLKNKEDCTNFKPSDAPNK